MDKLLNKLKGKSVHIIFNSVVYAHRGIVTDYKVLDYMDGFLKLSDSHYEIVYFNPSLINKITLIKLEKEKNNLLEANV